MTHQERKSLIIKRWHTVGTHLGHVQNVYPTGTRLREKSQEPLEIPERKIFRMLKRMMGMNI